MNAAIAMQPNAFGHTHLGHNTELPHGEVLEINDETEGSHEEFQPRISTSGELIHNQSVRKSPALQKFLSNFAESQNTKSEPANNTTETVESKDFMNLDEYEKEFDNFHDDVLSPASTIGRSHTETQDKNTERKKRFATTKSLVRYCTECGFSFDLEKFCPHCGQKRATYAAPSA